MGLSVERWGLRDKFLFEMYAELGIDLWMSPTYPEVDNGRCWVFEDD